MKIAGTSESQPLVLKRDPNQLEPPEAALAANVALVRQVAADDDSALVMINPLENVRGQLAALKASMKMSAAYVEVAA